MTTGSKRPRLLVDLVKESGEPFDPVYLPDDSVPEQGHAEKLAAQMHGRITQGGKK